MHCFGFTKHPSLLLKASLRRISSTHGRNVRSHSYFRPPLAQSSCESCRSKPIKPRRYHGGHIDALSRSPGPCKHVKRWTCQGQQRGSSEAFLQRKYGLASAASSVADAPPAQTKRPSFAPRERIRQLKVVTHAYKTCQPT